MKTNELIEMLSSGPDIKIMAPHSRIFLIPLFVALSVAVTLMLTLLGKRSDLIPAMEGSNFWIKVGFCLALAVVASLIAYRLVKPGIQVGNLYILLGLPIVLLWCV